MPNTATDSIMRPMPDPPLTFGRESRWKTVGRWALRIATFGVVARYGRLQPRDLIPELVAAMFAARVGHVTYIDLVDRVTQQIEAMAWDKATKRAARSQAIEMLWERYKGALTSG